MLKDCLVFFPLLFAIQPANAAVNLFAEIDIATSSISLRWNMIDYSSGTAYVLLKSSDGVVWEQAAANPVFRNYNAATVLAYRDHFWEVKKYFYRVKIYNIDFKTLALSNIAVADVPKNVPAVPRANPAPRHSEGQASNALKAWQIYPNPVKDVLNIVYKKSEALKGIIKVIVLDATGKLVLQFRQASNNKQLRIPVSNLRPGFYFIKIDVLDEVQMNDRFIKE